MVRDLFICDVFFGYDELVPNHLLLSYLSLFITCTASLHIDILLIITSHLKRLERIDI